MRAEQVRLIYQHPVPILGNIINSLLVIAALWQRSGSDIVCRYGGEEFFSVFLDCGIEQALPAPRSDRPGHEGNAVRMSRLAAPVRDCIDRGGAVSAARAKPQRPA